MKVNKRILMLMLVIYTGIGLSLESQMQTNMHFGLLKGKVISNESNALEHTGVKEIKKITKDDLPDASIYTQGWLKYTNYFKKSDTSKPKFFYKNEAFTKQQDKPITSSEVVDEFGSKIIPSQLSFFGVLYKDKLNFLSSRDTPFLRVVDSLPIDIIHNIPDDSHLKGGIKDMGKFTEGYCFQINTKESKSFFQMSSNNPVPSEGTEKVWLICSDQLEVKDKFMNLIIQLRLKKQHNVGLFYSLNKPDTPETMNKFVSRKEDDNELNSNSGVLDGYWVLLQDWSSCSKKCGGGQEFQHLMCVPPKKNGKPCEGPALRTRPCNPQPCPLVDDAEKILSPSDQEKVNPPIVKMMPLSSRPLRYDKCHIKESDAIFTKFIPDVGIKNNKEKIPARVIMNEDSVSLYTDETLKTELGTFIIKETKFSYIENNPNCFMLESPSIKGQLCNLSNDSRINYVEEWNYDFNLFKIQCHVERSKMLINNKEESELKSELNKKIEEAKLDIIQERTKKVQQKALADSQNFSKIDKIQETAMMALNKELKIDEMLQTEEAEREMAEERELKLKLDIEKKKDECLIKSIKEKQMEDQFNLNKMNQEKEFEEMRKEVQTQILNKRKQVKAKLLQMRKRAERKKKLLNSEIQILRTQVAEQLNKVNREGNSNNCFKAPNTDEAKRKISQYCEANLINSSPTRYAECLSIETFCYTCCETEFGDIHVKERDQCYSKCDEEPKKDTTSGSWQWIDTVK